MSVLVSSSGRLDTHTEFSKELFTEVSQNLKVFTDEEWESVKDNPEYKNILIAVYIRTDVDNLVLLIDKEKFARISNVPPFISDSGLYPNILLDIGFLYGKSLVESAFSFKSSESLKRFVGNSTCYPVGAVDTANNYVLVFNVVISEKLLRDTEIVLNQGFHFYPIDNLSVTDSLQKAISKSLIIVKGDDKNE